MLPEDAVRQTKEASPVKVSPAWSYGDGGLSSGGKKGRVRGTLCLKERGKKQDTAWDVQTIRWCKEAALSIIEVILKKRQRLY